MFIINDYVCNIKQYLQNPYFVSNFRIIISDDLDVAEKVLEKINYLFENGLPTTTLSKFIRVKRSIIIDWMNKTKIPHKNDLERIDEIIKLLDVPFNGNFKTVFRLSKSVDDNGETLSKILSNETIDKRALEKWLIKNRLTIRQLNAQENYKKMNIPLKDNGYDDGVGIVDPFSILCLIERLKI